jgi:lysylphosphatidylglycerol synthetase-like protein (DUF2156 family)
MRRPPSSAYCERLFLEHGRSACSYSVAFDADFERHHCSRVDAIFCFSRCAPLRVTGCFFDPLCCEEDVPAALDEFMEARQQVGDRIFFWQCGPLMAAALAQRGYLVNVCGLENNVRLPLALGGRRMRGLRRQVGAARRKGLTVEAIDGDADATVWAELRSVTNRWLRSRPQSREIRRATRRTPHTAEAHCTKVVCRAPDGRAVGWAALDHSYQGGELVGCGLNAVRYDSSASQGIAALLALDGAMIVHQREQQRQQPGEPGAGFPLLLALGESPLPSSSTVEAVALASSGTPDGMETGSDVRRWPSSSFVDALFTLVRERGRRFYGVQGLGEWKRKYRAEQVVTYCAVGNELPLREVFAALVLIFA